MACCAARGMSTVTKPHFSVLSEYPGFVVIDPSERCQYTFRTPAPVEPTPASTSQFHYPVDRAVQITTESLALPTVISVYVRNRASELVAEAEIEADVRCRQTSTSST